MQVHPSVNVVCPLCLSARKHVCVERVQEKIVRLHDEPHEARVQAWIESGRPMSSKEELERAGQLSDQRRLF